MLQTKLILKKENATINKKDLKLHQDATECYVCVNTFSKKFFIDKNYRKIRDHYSFPGKYRGAVHSVCNLRFNLPNEIPAVFHNGSK